MNTALSQQFGVQVEFSNTDQLSADQVTEEVSQAVKHVFDRQKSLFGRPVSGGAENGLVADH